MFILLFLILLFSGISAQGYYPAPIITRASYKYFGNNKSNCIDLSLYLGYITDNSQSIEDSPPFTLNQAAGGIGIQMSKTSKPKYRYIGTFNFFNYFEDINQISLYVLNYDETGYYDRQMEWIKLGYGFGIELLENTENHIYLYGQPRIGLTTIATNNLFLNEKAAGMTKAFWGIDYGARLTFLYTMKDYIQSLVWINYRSILSSPDYHEIEISGEINYIFEKGKYFTYPEDGPLSIDHSYYYGPEASIFLKLSYLKCCLNSIPADNFSLNLGVSIRLIDLAQPPGKIEKY